MLFTQFIWNFSCVPQLMDNRLFLLLFAVNLLKVSVSMCLNCTKKDLWIGVFATVDTSGGGWNSAGVLPAIEMAVDDVNNDSDILTDYTLRMTWRDTKCNTGYGFRQFVDLIQLPRDKAPMMLIGGGCSVGTEATAEASQYWNLIQIAYSANSMALSNSKRFPLLYRTCYSESIGNPARIAILKKYGWTRVATVVQDKELFTLTMVDLRKLLEKENFTTLTSETLTNDPRYQIVNIKSKDARIIIAMFYSKMARKVFCAAYKEGIYGKQYQWIIPGWFDQRWWEIRDEGLDCTPAQIKLAAGNYIAAMEATWSSDPRKTINGQNASTLNQRYSERVKKTPYTNNEYCVFGYDAVWAVALAMNKSIETLRAQGKSLEQFSYNDSSITHVFKENLQSLHYQGMSGEISFDKYGDRIGTVVIEQLQGDSEVVVAEYDSHASVLRFHGKKVIWQGGSPPVDQTHITPELVSISLPLMVIMTIFAGIGIILATGFLIFNVLYGDRRFIRMSSPRLNSITVIGCFLIYFNVICSGIGDGKFVTASQFSAFCQGQAWILSIAFTLAYGAMFSKTWRVHILFLRKIERRSIKDHQLLAMVAGLLFIDVIVLTTWQFVDPLRYTEKYLPVIEEPDGFSARRPYIVYCSCEHTAKWQATLFTYKGILLIFGAFLAWETRNVTIPALNDSKNIGVSVYTVVLSCVIGLPVVMVISDMPDFTYGLLSTICLLCTTITLCLMFVPKILMLGKPDLERKDVQTERFYSVKGNTVAPNDSKSTSSVQSGKGQLEPPASIRRESRVVKIQENAGMDCSSSSQVESTGSIPAEGSEETEEQKN